MTAVATPYPASASLSEKISAAPPLFGFRKGDTGGHTARSMMLREMERVQRQVRPEATRADYDRAILDDNLLNKPTGSSRIKSLRHLRELYTLDPQFTLFRLLRQLAASDPASLPLLALVCVFCRDPQLRESFSLVKSLKPGDVLPRENMEDLLEDEFPGRFSLAMKKSLAQNVNTTWTASGHLEGRSKKIRRLPECRPAAAAYALTAGYLLGLRGPRLTESIFSDLVAPNPNALLTQLPQAALRGFINFKHAGGVMELDCTPLLTPAEKALTYDTH